MMLRLVELEDGTFRLEICMESDFVKYREVSRFEKIALEDIPEKPIGYKLECRIVTE